MTNALYMLFFTITCSLPLPRILPRLLPSTRPHTTLHIIHELAAKHCCDDMTTDAVHEQSSAFACRHRTGYNLLADFPLAYVRKPLEASYGKHQNGHWPGTLAPWGAGCCHTFGVH